MAVTDDSSQLFRVLNLLHEAVDINIVIAQPVHFRKSHFICPCKNHFIICIQQDKIKVVPQNPAIFPHSSLDRNRTALAGSLFVASVCLNDVLIGLVQLVGDGAYVLCGISGKQEADKGCQVPNKGRRSKDMSHELNCKFLLSVVHLGF